MATGRLYRAGHESDNKEKKDVRYTIVRRAAALPTGSADFQGWLSRAARPFEPALPAVRVNRPVGRFRAVASAAIISHNPNPIMLIRILRVVLMLLWLELGLLLILMPWSEVWDVNYFLYQYPVLALFLKNPYLRGMISGLGVMNVLFALEGFRRRTSTVVTRT